MKSKLLLIFGCLCFSIVLLIGLFQISVQPLHRPGGFTRRYYSTAPRLLHYRPLGEQAYYLAGATPHHLYLGNATIPNRFLRLDDRLKILEARTITLGKEKITWIGVEITIDSPRIFITECLTPSILQGHLHPFTATPVTLHGKSFSDCLPLSAASYVVKSYDTVLQQDVLAKLQAAYPSYTAHPSLLQKQLDGRFCEDGLLLASPAKNYLAYLYYYRNEFLLMDSNLSLIGYRPTIDTNTRAKIQLNAPGIHHETTITAASQWSSHQAYLADHYLYVHSAVLAENERPANIHPAAVIDVYVLPSGVYQGSFYVPSLNGSAMTSFMVTDSALIACYRKPAVAIFSLPRR